MLCSLICSVKDMRQLVYIYVIGCCGAFEYFGLYISFIIYLYLYEVVFIRKRRSICRQGALREHLNTHVYAGGRFQLLLLTTCIHLSLILLLYYSATTTSTIAAIHITSATKQPRSSVWSLRRIAS